MDGVAAAEPQVRHDLFAETASRMGVDARIIEKDFWVCWALKQLFALPTHGTHFTFKGGTTLSKVFGVIQRFSEDVDIAVDWVPLGFVGDRDPAASRSKTKQARLLDEMLETCRKFVAGDLRLRLGRQFAALLNQDWILDVDPVDSDSLRFTYPSGLSLERSYVLDRALLERVVAHKQRFYPAAWARYDLAQHGSLRLVPQAARVAELRRDYAAMEVMFFGPRPEFEVLLAELQHLEHAINDVGT